MGKSNTKHRKSVKNLYDATTGLPIMINLYVIKYLYYHIDKADQFYEKKVKGKKPKSFEVYKNEIPVSRQRFDRINKGMSFEFASGEADFVTVKFGIDMKYFRRENPIAFEIEGISQIDWKCFYNDRYNCGYELPSGFKKDYVSSRADKVEEKLKSIALGNWKNQLEQTDPLYAICYYFQYGKRFDALGNIGVLRKALQVIDYTEWESQSAEVLQEDYLLLQKHCDYINSLLTIQKLRNEK